MFVFIGGAGVFVISFRGYGGCLRVAEVVLIIRSGLGLRGCDFLIYFF